jgi:uncharacterized membrane protein
MLGNLFVVVLAVVNLWLRYTGDVAQSVIPWGLTLSVVIMAVLIYTGWKGGEPVYRWRVGMQPEEPIE